MTDRFSVSRFGIRSLLLKTNVTTTSTTYNLYGGRKFSDYDFIIVTYMDDANASPGNVRATTVLPATFGYSSGVSAIHGATSGDLKDYKVSVVSFARASDTAIILTNGHSAALKGVAIEGVRVRA